MAITFPRSFPAGALFTEVNFRLADLSVFNILNSGAVQAMERGPQLWSADFTTMPMAADSRRIWQAWELTLRGGRTFLAFDPEKEFPSAYEADVLNLTRAAGGAFDGTATLLSYTERTVQVSGLPATYEGTVGDMLSFAWNGLLALHMLVEDAVASSGGIVEFRVLPKVRLSPAPTIGAAVALVKPMCVMKTIPNSFSAPASPTPTAVSFEGVQAITP